MRTLPPLLVVLVGCGVFSSSDDRTTGDDPGVDGGAHDADADTVVDASGADANAPTTFFQLGDKKRWSTFDIHDKLSPALSGFFGAAFDGRFLYFAPHGSNPNSGRALRYDTTKPFGTGDGWVWFDAEVFAKNRSTQYRGAIATKDRVFYVPGIVYGQVPPPAYLLAHRSGEATPLAAKSSWTAQNLYSEERKRFGYFGGAFDGRYLYLAPNVWVPPDTTETRVLRIDTERGLEEDAAYEDAVLAKAEPAFQAQRFAGAAFDGKYVYFVPGEDGDSRRLVRLDAKAASLAALEHYDLGEVDPTGTSFCGAVFDGRYLYLAPNSVGDPPKGLVPASKVLRYDTTRPIAQKGSWERFDLKTVSADATVFCGGQFDGRYVYLAPTQWEVGAARGGATLVRFDTTKGKFADASSWDSLDLRPQIGDGQIAGSAFDGTHLYLVPRTGGKLVRFEARSTRELPKVGAGVASFF